MAQYFYGLKQLLFIAPMLFVFGCSSYVSESSVSGQPVHDGIVYYMPMRPIIVQVVVTGADEQHRVETPSLVAADAMPDLSERFVLSDEDNWIAEDHLTLAVSERGLLQSADTVQTSGADAILTNLSSALGTAIGGSLSLTSNNLPELPHDDCQRGKTYNVMFWRRSDFPGRVCGFNVTLVRTGSSASIDDNVHIKFRSSGSSQKQFEPSGIFYKAEIPYVLTFTPDVTLKDSPISFVAYSPDDAPISFLPIKRAIFADNTVHIKMKDGELTSFEQDNTGEIVALSKIPADVIKAYFNAISAVFPAFVAANNDKQTLALYALQSKVCRDTITANPIKGTPEEQQAAVDKIKVACPMLPTPPS